MNKWARAAFAILLVAGLLTGLGGLAWYIVKTVYGY
jgi:hypothetical protein